MGEASNPGRGIPPSSSSEGHLWVAAFHLQVAVFTVSEEYAAFTHRLGEPADDPTPQSPPARGRSLSGPPGLTARSSSSGSTAPRGTSRFELLPNDLHEKIVGHLPSDAPALARNMTALSGASRAVRHVVRGIDSFPKYELLGRLMRAAEADVSRCNQDTPGLVETYIPMLRFLGPQAQEHLVSTAIGLSNEMRLC